MLENYSVKPKFKIGDKVKMLSYGFLNEEKKEKKYFDNTGLVDNLKFGELLTITEINLVIDPKNINQPYYQYEVIEDYFSYHERWLRVPLNKKLDKLLKI